MATQHACLSCASAEEERRPFTNTLSFGTVIRSQSILIKYWSTHYTLHMDVHLHNSGKFRISTFTLTTRVVLNDNILVLSYKRITFSVWANRQQELFPRNLVLFCQQIPTEYAVRSDQCTNFDVIVGIQNELSRAHASRILWLFAGSIGRRAAFINIKFIIVRFNRFEFTPFYRVVAFHSVPIF